jgi:RNA polymerase sigma-70 factor (ECF subfamily)
VAVSASPPAASSIARPAAAAHGADIAAAPLSEASFREIFDAEFDYVANGLLRLGVPERDVDDVTHDVFVTFYRRIAEFDPERPLRPWLFGIALRHASDYRRSARHRNEVLSDASREPAFAGPGPESEAGANQTRALVLRALEAIDLDRRALLIMHDIDGISATDIGHALGVPANTVYSRLRVARERFRDEVRRIQLGEDGQP